MGQDNIREEQEEAEGENTDFLASSGAYNVHSSSSPGGCQNLTYWTVVTQLLLSGHSVSYTENSNLVLLNWARTFGPGAPFYPLLWRKTGGFPNTLSFVGSGKVSHAVRSTNRGVRSRIVSR
jgi:hypothetical protein